MFGGRGKLLMERLGPYEELAPALGRSDLFAGVRRFAAEQEPYAVLLLVTTSEDNRVPLASRRHHHLKSRWVLPLMDIGLDDSRYYLAMDCGPWSKRTQLERLSPSAPRKFWISLAMCAEELHLQGTFGFGLSEDTVAVSQEREPVLFDFLDAHGSGRDVHETVATDVAAFVSLASRLGAEDIASKADAARPRSMTAVVRALQ